MDEREWITAAKQGDLDAYNQIVLIHQEAVYNLAYSILRDHQSAEDCTQDAFLRAYLHLRDYRGPSFRAWILRIVRNACYDELRRRKRHPIFPLFSQNHDGEDENQLDMLADPGISVEETVERNELRSAIQQHLDALPENYRSALVLVDILELNYAEASTVLNIPLGTVKSRLARGRRLMSRALRANQDMHTPIFMAIH